MSLANNHSMDFMSEGMWDTIASLQRSGIACAGGGASREEAQAHAVVEAGGWRVAFLSYSDHPEVRRWDVTGGVRVAFLSYSDHPGVSGRRALLFSLHCPPKDARCRGAPALSSLPQFRCTAARIPAHGLHQCKLDVPGYMGSDVRTRDPARLQDWAAGTNRPGINIIDPVRFDRGALEAAISRAQQDSHAVVVLVHWWVLPRPSYFMSSACLGARYLR